MHQSSDSLSNHNTDEVQHQSFVPNQQANSSFIDKPMDFALEEDRGETPVELEHIDAQQYQAPINQHVQYQDNNKQNLVNDSNKQNLANDSNKHNLANDSNDQNHPFQSTLNNDPQQLKDNSLLTEDIQDLQISESNATLQYQMDNYRHYSSYFFQQTDFKDYTHSITNPRAPKLFTGKRYVS